MKTLSGLHKPLPFSEAVLVDMINTVGGYQTLQPPVMSDQLTCPSCGNSKHYVFTEADKKKIWICGLRCVTNRRTKGLQPTYVPPTSKRALLWPLFCEINGIGDALHDVCFEKINQSTEKINFLRSFCSKPSGIIYMSGTEGSGKTYACLGLCELFTRKNDSCVFITHQQLLEKWLYSFQEKTLDIMQKVLICNLLVVDDFGTGTPTKGFMEYFMHLINSRMQWTDRGTVITSNLKPSAFTECCGSALADRLKTAQPMIFTDKSRRGRKPI